MEYQRDDAREAWKTFVGSGVLLEDKVRPMIARSWLRCRAAGVDPWSDPIAKPNPWLLEEKRERYAKSLKATEPVMRFLKTLFGCNVSIMDGENFVFELLTPLSEYSRTFGTYVRESEVGTGNATLVAFEKAPVRADGFEHYRSAAQMYSGVSAPYLESDGKYYGALNINNPFGVLPPSALDICKIGVELTNDLFLAGSGGDTFLSTVEFYKPIMSAFDSPILIVDMSGKILSANAGMLSCIPDWDQYSYGSQSLDRYLGKGFSSKDILKYLKRCSKGCHMSVDFKKGRTRQVQEMDITRCGMVENDGQEPFAVFVFEPQREEPKVERKPIRRKPSIARGADYVGESEEWQKVDQMVKRVAPIKANVLLVGETGTGKEVVARALHKHSGRDGEFVAINCGALPYDLLATELFGYEGGAFTGARQSGAAGKFEYADGGTLFLDEIGEMPIDMQVSLLRVLQEQTITRLGSNKTKTLDLRVVAATNRNIEQLISENKFRSDLYYRLSLIEISLPQLRHRVSDIPLFIDYFNESFSATLNVPCTPFPKEVVDAMCAYSWPGNVRELRNIVERCLIMCGDGSHVTLTSIPQNIANAAGREEGTGMMM